MIERFKLAGRIAMAAVVMAGAAAAPAYAQGTQTQRTQEQRTDNHKSEHSATGLDSRDRMIAEIWGINQEEMTRAKLLAQGPRANFSVPNLSPLEVLGIHARNDTERRKYAEQFARIFHADVERSLAWNAAYEEAIARLYPNEKIVDFSGMPKVNAPVGSADAMNVPRSLINESGRAPRQPVSR